MGASRSTLGPLRSSGISSLTLACFRDRSVREQESLRFILRWFMFIICYIILLYYIILYHDHTTRDSTTPSLMAGYYAGVPPFSGAPPLPAGVKIPVQHWNGGHWIPNPHFNPLAPPWPGPAWMPSHAWHLPPPVNPYKRQPRQPSAEYLAHKLSDNPLGLSNMIPV